MPGALKVYAGAPGAFGDEEQQVLGLLADAAAILLGAAQPVEAPARLSAALQAALVSRETVGMAAGVLMAREHQDPEAAQEALLAAARAQGRRVAEVAAQVLETAQAPGQGPDGGQGGR